MTEKGGPMPLMGECSCPAEPSAEPRPGPRDGCREGAAMEPRPVGELRGEEVTGLEKSGRKKPGSEAGSEDPSHSLTQPATHPHRAGPPGPTQGSAQQSGDQQGV